MKHFILLLITLLTVNSFAGIPVSGLLHDASSTSIATSHTEIAAATAASCASLSVFNSTGEPLALGVGASSSEIDLNFMIAPSTGMIQNFNQPLKKGLRLTAKSLGSAATTGILIINCSQ